METRSQRQQARNQRLSYSQISTQTAPKSPSPSVYQSSSSSLSSVSSINTAMTQPSSTSSQPQQGFMSAPLPSPSSSARPSYFGLLSQQAPTSHPQQGQRSPQQQPVSGTYVGERGDGGGVPVTAPFLKECNLLAEAASRAQMHCLTRELGDVDL